MKDERDFEGEPLLGLSFLVAAVVVVFWGVASLFSLPSRTANKVVNSSWVELELLCYC